MFYYDDWGRMISKDQGDYGANYEYRYGDKLKSVTSNFPDEADVTYQYGSDGKRRSRDTSSSYTWYNWDAGWNVINEESSGNTLERTYIHDPGKVVGTILAHATGSTLSTGWRIYLQDMLGSTRHLRYSGGGYAGHKSYTPYGDASGGGGSWNTSYMFTGKDWDEDAQMYYFPYRYYSPGIGRWTTRDPLMSAGSNLYSYAVSNPVCLADVLGLKACCPDDDCPGGRWACITVNRAVFILIGGRGSGKGTCRCLSNGKKVGIRISCTMWGVGLDAAVGAVTWDAKNKCNASDLTGRSSGFEVSVPLWGLGGGSSGVLGGEPFFGADAGGIFHVGRLKCRTSLTQHQYESWDPWLGNAGDLIGGPFLPFE